MAFTFDYSPMAAIGALARKAGKGAGISQAMSAVVQMRGQNLADARSRQQMNMQAADQERGFKLQMADAQRKDRALDASIASTQASDTAKQLKFQTERVQRDTDFSDWNSIRDELSRPDYIRGLIAIRGGGTPPALTKRRTDLEMMEQGNKNTAWIADQMKKFATTLQGYYQNDSGDWMESVNWGFDKAVTEPTRRMALDSAKTGAEQITTTMGEMKQTEENQAQSAGPEARMSAAFNSFLQSKSVTQQGKINRLLQNGWTPEQVLKKEQEYEEQRQASMDNHSQAVKQWR